MDAAEIVNKAAADLAPMTVKDYLDDIGEFLDDAEHFELADDSTVDITPALNGLRAVEAQIESDAKVIAALREALDRHDRWLAKAADTLNISARMSDMDLGSEITKYRRKFLAANEQTAGESK